MRAKWRKKRMRRLKRKRRRELNQFLLHLFPSFCHVGMRERSK
jgi:hypothetical protein